MTHWWLANSRRGAKRAGALRAPLRLELLEARNLLTASLVVVPSPVISESQLLAAAAIAHNDIWAVGGIVTSSGGRTTLAEHFNGTSWSVVPTPAVNDALVSVAASASNDVWAVGTQIFVNDSPTPFIAHWNGTSWSIIDSPKLPKNSSLTGVTGPASNNAWVVGNTFGSSNALIEHWDGTHWSIVSSPAFAGVFVSTIAADSSTDVWAFGLSNVTGKPEALRWNGTTWTAVPATGVFEALGVAALSPTNVWAAGVTADGDHDATVPAAEHWNGTSWSMVPVPNPNPNTSFNIALTGIAAISANDIWAVGYFPVIGATKTLTEHWDGTSWSIIASPNPRTVNELFGVTALSDGTVAAVGFQEDSKILTGLILQNAGSAPPKTAAGTTAAAPTTAMFLPGDARPAGTTAADPAALATKMPAPLDAPPVEPVLAAPNKADHLSSLVGHSSGAYQVVAIWNLDFLPEDIGLQVVI